MKLIACAALLAITATATAEVSFRTLGSVSSQYSGSFVSNDGRIVTAGPYRWTDFVRATYGQPQGLNVGISGVVAMSESGIEVAADAFRQGFSGPVLLVGFPAAGSYLSSTSDECGDGAVYNYNVVLNQDASRIAYEASYIGDNACGYQGTGGRIRAVYWDRENQVCQLLFVPSAFADLPTGPVGSRFGIAVTGISSDGSLVCGTIGSSETGYSQAYLWSQATGPTRPFLSDSTSSIAFGISPDGGTIAGGLTPSHAGIPGGAFLWSEAHGYRWLGDEPGTGAYGSFRVVAMSNQAEFFVGSAYLGVGQGAVEEATIWDHTGMRLVRDLATPSTAPGFPAGYRFLRASDISPDGSFVVGRGQHPTTGSDVWYLRLRGVGDANSSGFVDAADLSVLLSSFGTNVPPCTEADFNCDGVINSADLSVLLGAFGTAVP